jgi:hypothetical protein
MIKWAQVGVQFKMGKMEIILRWVHPPDLKCALKLAFLDDKMGTSRCTI